MRALRRGWWGTAELSNPKCAVSVHFGRVRFAGEEDGRFGLVLAVWKAL